MSRLGEVGGSNLVDSVKIYLTRFQFLLDSRLTTTHEVSTIDDNPLIVTHYFQTKGSTPKSMK